MFDKKNLHDEYCVAFVDILGFKNMTSNGQINIYGPIINEAIENMKKITKIKHVAFRENLFSYSIQTVQFADSIVLLFPKDFKHCMLSMSWLAFLQFELAKKGIFLRGAICTGQMYIDEHRDIYYGEAWNKAVQQEEKAVYPRIILERSLALMIENDLRGINEGVIEFYLSSDDYYVLSTFRDYFWADGDAVDYFYQNDMKMILTKINEKITNERNDSILRKYSWLVGELIETSKDRNEYTEVNRKATQLKNDILSRLI